MTTVTIKKMKFNVEDVVEQAISIADSGAIKIDNPKDVKIIQASDNPAKTERQMVLAQAIYKALKYTWSPRWNRIDENDLVGSILESNTNRVNNIRRGFGK